MDVNYKLFSELVHHRYRNVFPQQPSAFDLILSDPSKKTVKTDSTPSIKRVRSLTTQVPKPKSAVMSVLKEAYEDSTSHSPIFFLVSHSVQVYQSLIEFQHTYPEYANIRLQYLSLGKGLEKKVEEKMVKASLSGE